MKMIFVFILLPLSLASANPAKNSNLNPAVEKPVVPGTHYELDRMNSSSNPIPSENRSEKFRGTLKGKQLQEEDQDNKKQNKKKNEAQSYEPQLNDETYYE